MNRFNPIYTFATDLSKSKGKIVRVLSYHAVKKYLLLNQAPLHEDVLGDWSYSSMHS